jgi:ubiquinone/menaquinone biosynthesis C-methylase UbiE
VYESVPQKEHPALPRTSHDERARQLFAKDFRKYMLLDVPRSTRQIWETEVKPTVAARSGSGSIDHQTARDAMWQHGFLRAAMGLQRVSQELLWNSITPVVERQAASINAEVAAAAKRGPGSLDLDANVPVPEYLTQVDIHCMPGNYHTECAPGDASLGAVFDRGSFLYALGGAGELNDAIGRLLVMKLREQYPLLAPRRILDMGCTIGHNTLPLCDAYPDAELHAVDVGAPMLRYAHARAVALGKKVHWHQRDVRDTRFPDGHFDLVTSSIMFHEVHPDEIGAVFREAWRVLAPGGVMAHIDIPNYFAYPDPLLVSLVHADTFHNNEPFWGEMHRRDLVQLMVDAGFPSETCFRGVAAMGTFPWSWFGAVKA